MIWTLDLQMFTGNQPTSPAAFTRMSAEEKLLSAKDLGEFASVSECNLASIPNKQEF